MGKGVVAVLLTPKVDRDSKNAAVYVPAIGGAERMSGVHLGCIAEFIDDNYIDNPDAPPILIYLEDIPELLVGLNNPVTTDPTVDAFITDNRKQYVIEMGADWPTTAAPFFGPYHIFTSSECHTMLTEGDLEDYYSVNTPYKGLIFSHSTLSNLSIYMPCLTLIKESLAKEDEFGRDLNAKLKDTVFRRLATNLVRLAGANKNRGVCNIYSEELLRIFELHFPASKEGSNTEKFSYQPRGYTIKSSLTFKPKASASPAQQFDDFLNGLIVFKDALREYPSDWTEEEFDLAMNDYMIEICQKLLKVLCAQDENFLKLYLENTRNFIISSFAGKMTLMRFSKQAFRRGANEVNAFDFIQFAHCENEFEMACASSVNQKCSCYPKQMLVDATQIPCTPKQTTLSPSKEQLLAQIPDSDPNAIALFLGSIHNQPGSIGYQLNSTVRYIKKNPKKISIFYVGELIQTHNVCPISHDQFQSIFAPFVLAYGVSWYSQLATFCELLGLPYKRLTPEQIVNLDSYTPGVLNVVFHSDAEQAFQHLEDKGIVSSQKNSQVILSNLKSLLDPTSSDYHKVCAYKVTDFAREHLARLLSRYCDSSKSSKSASVTQLSRKSVNGDSNDAEEVLSSSPSSLPFSKSMNDVDLIVDCYKKGSHNFVSELNRTISVKKHHAGRAASAYVAKYVIEDYFPQCRNSMGNLNYSQLKCVLTRLNQVLEYSLNHYGSLSSINQNEFRICFMKNLVRLFVKHITSIDGPKNNDVIQAIFNSSESFFKREAAIIYCMTAIFSKSSVEALYPSSLQLFETVFKELENVERKVMSAENTGMPKFTTRIIKHDNTPPRSARYQVRFFPSNSETTITKPEKGSAEIELEKLEKKITVAAGLFVYLFQTNGVAQHKTLDIVEVLDRALEQAEQNGASSPVNPPDLRSK
jgi:hypothetical protein